MTHLRMSKNKGWGSLYPDIVLKRNWCIQVKFCFNIKRDSAITTKSFAFIQRNGKYTFEKRVKKK